MESRIYNETIRKLENELSEIKATANCFVDLTEKAIGLCDMVIIKLREIVLRDGFKDDAEEIYFFKYVKPCINSKLIFYIEIFNIESNRPNSGKKGQIRYLKDVLPKYCNFIKENTEFYQYYKRDKTFLDHIYFIRGNANCRIHVDNLSNYIDPEFSTGYDQTLARILAYEHLKAYIGEEIDKLATGSTKIVKQKNEFVSSLEWTGPKIAITELVYALYFVKVLNNGQVDIIEIAQAFEKMFNIKLDDIYRSFKDIQARSTVRTRFLDNLRETLLRQMDDLDK